MRLPELVNSLKFTVHSQKKSNDHELRTLNRKSLGFTLIELLVVISIIGILAGIAAASFTRAQTKARDGKRKVDLKATQQAIDSYIQTNGSVPLSFAGQIRCGVTGDFSIHVWGTTFICGVAPNQITYMNTLPVDPATPTYGYNYIRLSTLSYRIDSVLENTSDQDYCPPTGSGCTKLPCQPSSGYNYCVINP